MTALAAEHMPAGSAVINISSKAAMYPSPSTVVYAAAKAGLNVLTKAAGQEFGPRGIRVNCIVCGTFHTDSLHKSMPTEEIRQAMASSVSVGRIASSDEIVGTALYLASDSQFVSQRRADRSGRRVNMDTLEDKVVVITGGASGIGLALARAVTIRGAHVAIADVQQSALDAARDSGELPADTLAVRTDVSDPASVAALRDAVLEQHGRVDVLCNNAGVSTYNLLADQTLDDWRWVLGVNLWGVIHGIDAFLPVLRSQGTPAHIVNTASVAGLISGIPFIGPYAVSKVGVVAISETLRQELTTHR